MSRRQRRQKPPGDRFPSGRAGRQLLERTASLKTALVAYIVEHHEAAIFGERGAARLPFTSEEIQRIEALLAEFRDEDGRRIHDRFVSATARLSREERRVILDWKDHVFGVFRIETTGEVAAAFNEVDELSYRIVSNEPALFNTIARGSWLLMRVVRFMDVWLVSGDAQRILDEAAALSIAVDLRTTLPALAFRNPDILKQAREMVEDHRELFLEQYGTDFLVGPPALMQERYREHLGHCQRAASSGAADVGLDPATVDFPEDLLAAESVGLLFDRDEDLLLLRNAGRVIDYLDGDDASEGAELLGYLLTEDSVSPAWFIYFARRASDRLELALKRVTGHERFTWQRHGEALLRSHKRGWYDAPAYPGQMPLPERLVRALKSADE